MFKDRRVLMEQELVKQKQACGEMYYNIVMDTYSKHDVIIYESMKSKLADMIAELAIVDQMITDGHQ